MKTPWKMFADLVSRKPASASQGGTSPTDGVNSIGHQAQTDDAAPKAPRSIVKNEMPASVASSKVAANGPDKHDDVEQADAPSLDGAVAGETQAPLAKLQTQAPVVRTIKRPAGSGAAKRGKRANNPAEQKTAAPAVDPPTEGTMRPKTALEEWAELDAEISDVRHRLAEKLSLQNAQLREMLEHFDRQSLK